MLVLFFKTTRTSEKNLASSPYSSLPRQPNTNGLYMLLFIIGTAGGEKKLDLTASNYRAQNRHRQSYEVL
jgi:hypothetical protein